MSMAARRAGEGERLIAVRRNWFRAGAVAAELGMHHAGKTSRDRWDGRIGKALRATLSLRLLDGREILSRTSPKKRRLSG